MHIGGFDKARVDICTLSPLREQGGAGHIRSFNKAQVVICKLFPLYDQGGAGHMSLGALTKLKSSEIISPTRARWP